MRWIVALLVTAGLLVGCSSDESGVVTQSADGQAAEDSAILSKACAEAFERAAAVDEMSDTNEDMDPAMIDCASLGEFKAGSEAYPDALDGVDPETYARNRCLFSENDAVKASSLCAELV